MNPPLSHARSPWLPILLGGLAGGMGWGIRGQYGHETGAMIAGLLIGLVMVLLFAPGWKWADAARAAALGTIAMGVGGSETYAQSIGLTQDANIVGNHDAWRWGMLGLAIKGGVWIGFAGLFFGIGFGGVRYRPLELVALVLALLGLHWVGVQVVNQPFDPAHRLLPKLYFSADWRWLPEATLKPRREVWGGLVLALVGAWTWIGWVRGDGLARRLAVWGVVGGAVGFPLGQCLQSYHAWHPELYRSGVWIWLDPKMNWWNWMETTFGTVMGAALGLGFWVHRQRIRPPQSDSEPTIRSTDPLTSFSSTMLLAVHTGLVAYAEFATAPGPIGGYCYGLRLLLLPIAALMFDARCAVLVLLPVTLMPIAGKTYAQLVTDEHYSAALIGMVFYLVVPLVSAVVVALWAGRKRNLESPAQQSAPLVLVIAALVLWGLNFEFFHRPWPWIEWTYRTPNNLFFTAALMALLGLAVRRALLARRAEKSAVEGLKS